MIANENFCRIFVEKVCDADLNSPPGAFRFVTVEDMNFYYHIWKRIEP